MLGSMLWDFLVNTGEYTDSSVSEVINNPRSLQLQLNLICLPCFKSRFDRMNGNKLSMRTFITGWHVM